MTPRPTRQHTHLLRAGSLLVALLLAAGCGSVRYRSAEAAQGDGVRVALGSAKARRDHIKIDLRITNHSKTPIIVNHDQIALVGPDGNDYYCTDRHATVTVKVGERERLRFTIDTKRHLDFHKVPGVYLRFDGVWSGSTRLKVSPLLLGKPVGGPGQTNTAFTAPQSKPIPVAKTKAGPAPVLETHEQVKSEIGGLQQYNGPRHKIKDVGAKCAAMPLRASDVPKQVAFIMDELLLTELQHAGFEAIGPDDINAMIGFETVKSAVGCNDASCMTEIGNALGVPYLAAGNVAQLDGSTVLTLKLIDVKHTKVLARVNRMANGGTSVLPKMIAEAVQELVQRSKI